MGRHKHTVERCPVKNIEIPAAFRNDLIKGIPNVVLFVIGYRGHGKTCFLSSFFHTLYNGVMADRKIWPGFSFMGLNMDSLNKIHKDYVNILERGYVPPPNLVMFPTPLLLRFQRIPFKGRGFKRLFNHSNQGDIIFTFYDIGGETYEVEQSIRENLPILKEINTLLFLIDLPRLVEDAQEKLPVEQRLHDLINIVYLAKEGLGGRRKKNIIVCFSKADLMWDKEEIFGPLAMRRGHDAPSLDELPEYFKKLSANSHAIAKFMERKYPTFYNDLCNNFASVFFTSLSSLGNQPVGDRISVLAPSHIFDPVLWTLKSERYL